MQGPVRTGFLLGGAVAVLAGQTPGEAERHQHKKTPSALEHPAYEK